MHRLQFTLKTLLWSIAVVAAFCAGTQLDRYLDEHRADPSETRIWAALDEKTDLDFVEQPFYSVIDYLKQCHGIEIQLDLKSLSHAGIRSDTPITRGIKGVTLRSALKLLLSDLDLSYAIDNGVLLITTKTEAESAQHHLLETTALLLLGVVAAFLAGIQCARAWRRRADTRGHDGQVARRAASIER